LIQGDARDLDRRHTMGPVLRLYQDRACSVAPSRERQVRLERPAVEVGSGGFEPACHRGVQRDRSVRACDHAEPQDSWRTPWRKGPDASERQLERCLSDVKVHALDDRGADGLGRVAGKRQRQMQVFWTNNLQPASALTQRGNDRHLFGRDRSTCIVGQINGRENAHKVSKPRS